MKISLELAEYEGLQENPPTVITGDSVSVITGDSETAIEFCMQ